MRENPLVREVSSAVPDKFYNSGAGLESRSCTFQEIARDMADRILKLTNSDISKVLDMEREAFDPRNNLRNDILKHTAIKLAKSKILLSQIQTPVNLSIVVPVFRETIRLKPRVSDGNLTHDWMLIPGVEPHPEGENIVYNKHQQLTWLLESNSEIKCKTIYVDDGCDHQSGKMVESLLNVNGYRPNTEVLFLDDVITGKTKGGKLLERSIHGLDVTEGSAKAGAVYVGLAKALEEGSDIVVYTDADLSYNLGEVGSLIHPIVSGDYSGCVANRGHELSFCEDLLRNESHPIGTRRIKALLGSLRNDIFGQILPPDTQAGFKAFPREVIFEVLGRKEKEMSLSFDIQLLARVRQTDNRSVATIPVVCLDSPEQTTADTSGTYEKMAHTFLRVAEEMGVNDKKSILVLRGLASNWKLFRDLMDSCIGSDYDTLGGELREYFSVSNNNTATSLPLTPEITGKLEFFLQAGAIHQKDL